MAQRGFLTDLLTGSLLALFVTVMMNMPLLRGLASGDAGYPDITYESSDEVFYLGRIREVLDGHWAVGQPSVYELRDQSYPAGILSEWLLGGLGSALGADLKTVSIAADLLLPFVLALLLWLAARRLLPQMEWRSALLIAVFLGVSLAFWKRPVSPQANTLLFFGWLLLFLDPRKQGWRSALRGALIGLMLFTYAFHWTYALAAEGMVVLLALLKDRQVRWRPLLMLAAGLLPFAAAYGLTHAFTADPQASAETIVRLGKIETRWPTGPRWQLLLLLLLPGTVWTWLKKDKTHGMLMTALLLAGFVVFNQTILLGWDAEFSNHYGKIIFPILWLALLWVAARNVRRAWARPLLGIALLFLTWTTWKSAAAEWRAWPQRVLPAEQRQADADLYAALNGLSGEQVILTDERMGRLLTLYTRHYPFFTSESQLSPVRNEELFTRALVQRAVLPEESIGPRALFGAAHLNAALQASAQCRVLSKLNGSALDCTKRPEDFLPFEWQLFIDAGNPEPENAVSILRERHVRYVLLKETPQWLLPSLEEMQKVSGYTLWRLKD